MIVRVAAVASAKTKTTIPKRFLMGILPLVNYPAVYAARLREDVTRITDSTRRKLMVIWPPWFSCVCCDGLLTSGASR